MNPFFKIVLFGLWSVAAHGQQLSKKEALMQCHAAYKRHLNKFREPQLIDPNEYKKNYDGFRTLFVDQGVQIYNPLQQQNALVGIEMYVRAFDALSDGATVEFKRILYCRDLKTHNLYYIHFEQSFRGRYTANTNPLPIVWLTMSVVEQGNGFKITSIRKAGTEAAADKDDDGDGVANRCDKCRTIAGGLEHWGADPFQPCVDKKEGESDAIVKQKLAEAKLFFYSDNFNAAFPIFFKYRFHKLVDAEAQFLMGRMYDKGIGVAKNNVEAVKWYRKAAEQGNANAQNNLGKMYEYGIGVAKNNVEAVKWYRKAAEQGNANAQNNLGEMYIFGDGVAKNNVEAVKWYRKAAEQGDAYGQYRLGFMYAFGIGVANNDGDAAYWFQKAAEQGDAEA